jgi:hypothetical protein
MGVVRVGPSDCLCYSACSVPVTRVVAVDRKPRVHRLAARRRFDRRGPWVSVRSHRPGD